MKIATAIAITVAILSLPAQAAPLARGLATKTVIVIAKPLEDSSSNKTRTHNALSATELKAAPNGRVDEALRSLPSFSLMRRNSSISAHPTTQGPSLRNIRLNGSARALITLDGIPLNDPFGGWVDWSRLPSAMISNAEIVNAGSVGPWGASALTGNIRLHSQIPDHRSLLTEGRFGSRDTRAFMALGGIHDEKITAQLGLSNFHTDGFYRVSSAQRGNIDTPLKSDLSAINVKLSRQVNDTDLIGLTGTFYRDERNAGTQLTGNSTTGGDMGLHIEGARENFEWQINSFYQYRRFAAQFASANAARSLETPALDQYAVPAMAGGLSVVTKTTLGRHVLEGGADFRGIAGQTKERFFFAAGKFQRERRAGGKERLAGFWLSDQWQASPRLLLEGGLRLDYSGVYDGHYSERVIATSTLITQSFPREQNNWTPSFRLGAHYDFTETIAFRASTYSGVRAPTLNELFRPFRVGNDITLDNPNLAPERLIGAEAALEIKPTANLDFEVLVYENYLRDGVANVLLTTTPGIYTPTGTLVPAGGSLARRENIDTTRFRGANLSAAWMPTGNFTLRGAYLYNSARITRASVAPGLVGQRLPQSSAHTFSLGVSYLPVPDLELRASIRTAAKEFNDLPNGASLKGYTRFDLSASYALTKNAELFAAIDNIANASIATDRAADGTEFFDAPRSFSAGIRFRFGG